MRVRGVLEGCDGGGGRWEEGGGRESGEIAEGAAGGGAEWHPGDDRVAWLKIIHTRGREVTNDKATFVLRANTGEQALEAVQKCVTSAKLPGGVKVDLSSSRNGGTDYLSVHLQSAESVDYGTPWFLKFRTAVAESLSSFLGGRRYKSRQERGEKVQKHFTNHVGVSLLPPPPNLQLIRLQVSGDDNQSVTESVVPVVAFQARIDHEYSKTVCEDDGRYPNAVDSEGIRGWCHQPQFVHYSFIIWDPDDGSLQPHDIEFSSMDPWERFVIVDPTQPEASRKLLDKTVECLKKSSAYQSGDEYVELLNAKP